jgi:hypothetical protein
VTKLGLPVPVCDNHNPEAFSQPYAKELLWISQGRVSTIRPFLATSRSPKGCRSTAVCAFNNFWHHLFNYHNRNAKGNKVLIVCFEGVSKGLSNALFPFAFPITPVVANL